jgi:molecular chaperone DnaJ
VRVATLDDKRVAIRIPAGTSAGKRFRIRGQGIARAERRGDLIVEVTIVAPEKLTEEQERLMRDFAAAADLKF